MHAYCTSLNRSKEVAQKSPSYMKEQNKLTGEEKCLNLLRKRN
jgi:hypothetical protein